MTRSKPWWAPLTGVAFLIVLIINFVIAGEPKDADHPPREIVQWYVDNKDAVELGAIFGVAAALLLIFFGAYLRQVLHEAGGEGESLSLVAFVGFAIVGVGAAIDNTILFAQAEAADKINPVAAQALQALWDNDFLPLALGVLCFLWATGVTVIRTGVFPKWLGWVMILLGIAGMTPVGFASAVGAGLLVVILSVMLTLRARREIAPAA
jgi:hypothetical protein